MVRAHSSRCAQGGGKRKMKKLPIDKQIVGNNDKVIVLYSPESFTAVGQFYADFGQVSDSQVKKIMKKHGYKIKSD